MDKGEDKKTIGRRGEDLACKFLMDRGQSIIERNWRCGHLEIDLITYDGDGLHFVEVKTRRTPVQAEPEDSVDRMKQKRIAKAAARYLAIREDKGLPFRIECRFDVVAIIFDENGEEIRYFPEAYFPIYL